VLKLPLEAQMTKLAPSVSVIIPAYNEESRIVDCLDALMRQTVKPYEIIVVNNNCTDKTAAIAQKYKGVIVVKEPIQGKAYAQSCGFNYATGDILGRFDADTVLPKDWVKKVATEFTQDPKLSGLTGYGVARLGVNVPQKLRKALSHLWSQVYFSHCQAFFGVPILWGGNMAIRRVDWLKIRNLCILLPDKNIHEDQDVSLALASIGGTVKIMPSLEVLVDFYETEHFAKYWLYLVMKRRNRRLHNAHLRSKLPTLHKVNWLKRAWGLLLTAPFEALYILFTLFNSALRFISKNTQNVC
jgi:cellulose synthase/poly-beta-1,6-N-acetylglucosamine synthase-like glycosyltransferase